MQLKVYQVLYCDFVVWNKEQLLRQRIMYDSQFIEDALKMVEGFIKQCILPELISKWFTQPVGDQILSTVSVSSSASNDAGIADNDVPLQGAQSDESDLPSTSMYTDTDCDVSVKGQDSDKDSSDKASASANVEANNLWYYCKREMKLTIT